MHIEKRTRQKTGQYNDNIHLFPKMGLKRGNPVVAQTIPFAYDQIWMFDGSIISANNCLRSIKRFMCLYGNQL